MGQEQLPTTQQWHCECTKPTVGAIVIVLVSGSQSFKMRVVTELSQERPQPDSILLTRLRIRK